MSVVRGAPRTAWLAGLALATLVVGGTTLASARQEEAEGGLERAELTLAEQLDRRLHEAAYGQVVRAIELRSDVAGVDVSELRRGLAIEVGEPLREWQVRRTISNLYVAGAGSGIGVWSRPAEEGQGIVAVVVVLGDYRVSGVELAGQLAFKRSRLEPLLEVKPGQVVIESRLLRTVYRLQDFYLEQGFRQAIVRLEADVDHERKRVAVTFRIEAGERATISDVEFTGSLGPFSPEQLLGPLRLGPGSLDTPTQLREDRERLRSFLREQGYLRARVDLPEELYDPDTNTVRLVYPVEVGPTVDVEVVGDDLDRLRRRDLLPVLQNVGFDEALVAQTVQRLRRFYQEQGYYEVEVGTEVTLEPPPSENRGPVEHVDLVVTIERNRPHRLVAMNLRGNETFSDSTLRPLFQTAPGQRLVDAVLRDDLENVANYYRLQGFADVVVGPAELDRRVDGGTAPAGEETVLLTLTIPILEGERRVVSGLEFEGAVAVDPRALDLPLEAGGGFHPQLVEESIRRVRSAYEERGFGEARVTAEVSWDERERLADVTLVVNEGTRTLIDRVLVRGNLVSRADMIRRVADLREGEPLSRGRLLEAQRRLYQLGVFTRVEVEPVVRRRQIVGYEPLEGMIEGDPLTISRDVLVRVSEGKRWRLGYGASWDSEDGFGGLFSSSYNNVWGRAATLRLDLRANQRAQRYRLLLNDRTLGRGDVSTNYAIYRLDEIISEFDSTRYGVQVEASRFIFDERLRGSLFFDYRDVELEPRGDLEDIDPGSLPSDIDRAFAPVEIASLTGTLIWNRANDPLFPTDGFRTLLQVEQAFPFIGAEEQFLKVFWQGSLFQPLPRGLGTFVTAIRFGGIEPQGGSLEDIDAVPIAERFFAGGRTTHRAYERDELGIPGETIIDGIAIGGNGLALVNLDWRFPIWGAFGGTLFFDTGNIWRRYTDIDFAEFEHGAGVGVRYDSPVGPIRFEVGFKLDPEEGQDREVYFLSFGYPF